MQLTPEIKAQLAEQKKECIFCKIVSKEQESKIVFEDDKTMAILDIYPAIKGHMVYLLKEHYPIMPYIPADEFNHFFGLVGQLAKAQKNAMVSTGVNVFIANGGVAGQRAGHFMIHFFPRENGDGFFNFLLKAKSTLGEKESSMLANNFPIMMQNHFSRNPASWHQGKGDVPNYLSEIYENNRIIYEDEKVLCVLPKKAVVPGHIEIYSKEEDIYIEKLSVESGAHIFYAASFAATALFEGLGAQGTNILLRSGNSDDNPTGKLKIDVLARMQDDALQQMLWESKQSSYDLSPIAVKIKDETWKIKYADFKVKTKSSTKPEVIKISSKKKVNEIEEAIKRVS